VLSALAINLLMHQGFSYALFGIASSLFVDSFFALRSEETSDVIEYTPFELFAM